MRERVRIPITRRSLLLDLERNTIRLHDGFITRRMLATAEENRLNALPRGKYGQSKYGRGSYAPRYGKYGYDKYGRCQYR